MTDYRMRNHDLLYADRKPERLGWRNLVIFGAIGVTVLLGVVSHLAGGFDLVPPGFPAVAQQAPAIQMAGPTTSRYGS